jgi:hypothetical protein
MGLASTMWMATMLTMLLIEDIDHMSLHGNGGLRPFNYKETIREGIMRAKARGVRMGRKPRLDARKCRKVVEQYAAGETIAALARDYECGVATIHRDPWDSY